MCKGPEAEVGLVRPSWAEAGPELRGGLDASVSAGKAQRVWVLECYNAHCVYLYFIGTP